MDYFLCSICRDTNWVVIKTVDHIYCGIMMVACNKYSKGVTANRCHNLTYKLDEKRFER